jgi:hypothetical protein
VVPAAAADEADAVAILVHDDAPAVDLLLIDPAGMWKGERASVGSWGCTAGSSLGGIRVARIVGMATKLKTDTRRRHRAA